MDYLVYTSVWGLQRTGGSWAVAGDYRDSIFTKLEHLQITTMLIKVRNNVWQTYGVQNSGR